MVKVITKKKEHDISTDESKQLLEELVEPGTPVYVEEYDNSTNPRWGLNTIRSIYIVKEIKDDSILTEHICATAINNDFKGYRLGHSKKLEIFCIHV